MSRTEDYLDGLLNSLDGDAGSQGIEAEREPREADLAEAENNRNEQRAGEDYLNSLEEEILSGDSSSDFIRQFEEELAQEDASGAVPDPMQDDSLFDSLDGIVNSVKERMQDEDDIMVDTLGDLPEEAFGIPAGSGDALAGLGEDGIPSMAEDALAGLDDDGIPGGPGMGDFGADDPEFAELFRTDGELPDIEELLGSDFGDAGLTGEREEDLYNGEENEFPIGSLEDILGLDEASAEGTPAEEPKAAAGEPESTEQKKDKKKDKKKEKAEKKDKVEKKEKGESGGFLQKISGALFDEGEKEEAQQPGTKQNETQMSDENLEILQQLEGDTVVNLQEEKKAAEDEKAKKKAAAKAARKAKKDAAKAAKKAKATKKKSKPKKEKKPKEPDKSKPLPKKPVILIYAMAASFLALVLLGTKYSGYSTSRSRAADYYSRGNYEQAFRELSGLEIAEDDQEVYEKYRILANASGEYSAYQTFMEAEIYDMALDSLIRTVGRCEKYLPDAQVYGCTGELTNVKNKAADSLTNFGVTEELALELYEQEDREVYSAQLYVILAANGYEVE